MNSLEKEQLGWISFHDISTAQTFDLGDFNSTGVAYRISLGNGEYLLLENHQLISQYDVPDANYTSPGLYILQEASGAASPNEGNLRVVSAAGRWNW